MRTLNQIANPTLQTLARHLARDYTTGKIEKTDFVTITESIEKLNKQISAATEKRNEKFNPRQEGVHGDGNSEHEAIAV